MRSINGTVVGNEDRNLNSSLYVMYGVGNRTIDELTFLVHGLEPDAIPTLSVQQFNPTLDTNDNVIMETVSLHNVIIGWILVCIRDRNEANKLYKCPTWCIEGVVLFSGGLSWFKHSCIGVS